MTNIELAAKYEAQGYIDIASDFESLHFGDGEELKQVVAALKSVSMNEERVREILKNTIQANGDVRSSSGPYISWYAGDAKVCLDAYFTADELEAIAWWMRNKSQPQHSPSSEDK